MNRRYPSILLLLCLLSLSSLSRADTYTGSWTWYLAGRAYTDPSAVITAYCGLYNQAMTSYSVNHGTASGVCSPQPVEVGGNASCPYGGNVGGYSGSGPSYNPICMNAPSCTPPQVRNATTGACEDPPSPCASKAGQSSYGWITIQIGGASPYGSKCSGGCAQYVTGPVSGPDNPDGDYYTNGKTRTEYAKWQFDGSSCSTGDSSPTPSTQPPRTPPKEPPCGPLEGVMTSSSGKINCVPAGTPESTPPVVKKEKETKTNPDGTTATTETTTTRDPSTGVEQKTSTTTTKDANGNTTGVTSSSGTSGTTSAGNPEKPGDSDFCQKNPTLDICTGKLNKEETQKKIADDIKSLTDPGTTSTDPLKNATHTTESENQLKTENDKFTDAAKGITDPTASSKSSWQQAMESGWFSSIPSAGCTPITGTVGGRQFAIDHCDKASQLSDIMSYALWFMLVVGSFVTVTGGQVRTQ